MRSFFRRRVAKFKRDLRRSTKKKEKWDVCRRNQHFLSQICSIDCDVCLPAAVGQSTSEMWICKMENQYEEEEDGLNAGDDADDFILCGRRGERGWQKQL